MYLRLSDLDSLCVDACCYLTHPQRTDDSDDILIDVANQFDFTKQDLMRWVTSTKSGLFMDQLDGCVDTPDFVLEFDSLR
jgi:hypothetical protein